MKKYNNKEELGEQIKDLYEEVSAKKFFGLIPYWKLHKNNNEVVLWFKDGMTYVRKGFS